VRAVEKAPGIFKLVTSVFSGSDAEKLSDSTKTGSDAGKPPDIEKTGSDAGTLPDSEKTGFFALFVSSLGGLLLLTIKGLVAFGVTPAVLLNSTKRNASVRDLQAQTSFRHRFAQEFREVTTALHPRSMVILIDDLDRCRPQNLLDLLEAVNFLVTSGDCYVIMGMDMSRIEGFVKAQYAETNEADFARKYLEKLINIEVPVPRPDTEQARAMIMPTKGISDSKYIDSLDEDRFMGVRRPFRYIALVASLLLVSFAVSYYTTSKPEMPAPPTVVAEQNGGIGGAVSKAADSGASKIPSQAKRPTVSEVRSEVEPVRNAAITSGVEPSLPIHLLAIPLVVLFVLGFVRLSKKRDIVVRDSVDFTDALTTWSDVIVAAHRTPRALKRFMNRIRYYAMQQSPLREREERWLRARLAWLRRKRGQDVAPSSATPPGIISEEKIVALCSLECVQSIGLWNEALFEGHVEWKTDEKGMRFLPPGSEYLERAIQAHKARFGPDSWPPGPADIEAIKRLIGGVRISV
jgi:hypothetical protein